MSAKKKFYVVWVGVEPGIYSSWTECQLQVNGFKGARFRSYASMAEAQEAYAAGPDEDSLRATDSSDTSVLADSSDESSSSAANSFSSAVNREGSVSPRSFADGLTLPPGVVENSLAVDAGCSGNPGKMEYRGVHVASRQQVFHFGPMYGTNNIGEFLAIVHGLALLKQKGIDMPIYSDSRNAIAWVKQKKCKTKLPRDHRTEQLFQIIERAEKWLRENSYSTPILKWETSKWGEIPADFGRK